MFVQTALIAAQKCDWQRMAIPEASGRPGVRHRRQQQPQRTPCRAVPCRAVSCRVACRQVGLNGIDNGAIRFSHVRVPRANLLDRFGTVDKSGRYSSPLTSQARRCYCHCHCYCYCG